MLLERVQVLNLNKLFNHLSFMEKNEIDIKDEDLKEEDFSPEELEAENVDWKAKAQELKGIAKRRATQLKKAKEKFGEYQTKLSEAKPPVKIEEKKPADSELLARIDELALQVAGISEDGEVELYNKWKTETSRDAKSIVNNSIFKAELQKLRDDKANEIAASNIKGGGGKGGTKDTPEYWMSKGEPPTPEQVPDRKTRAKIIRAMMNQPKGGGRFYNE